MIYQQRGELLRLAVGRGRFGGRPRFGETIVVAELMRRAVFVRFSELRGEPVRHRLAGKNGEGGKREGHDHPFFLPFDNACSGEIDGIDVWLPSGGSDDEREAIVSTSEIYDGRFFNDCFPLEFVGRSEHPRGKVWRSVTPVVMNRFPKMRGTGGSRLVDSVEQQIYGMLTATTDKRAEVALWHASAFEGFRRQRPDKPGPPYPTAGATITFEEPIEGPLVLGRLAHFGLGRFEPVVAG